MRPAVLIGFAFILLLTVFPAIAGAGTGVIDLSTQSTYAIDATMSGPDDLGASLAAGDFNGDGTMDVAIATSSTIFVVSTLNAAAIGSLPVIGGLPTFSLNTIGPSDLLITGGTDEMTLSNVGDLNKDGRPDLAIGLSAPGKVDVLFMPSAAEIAALPVDANGYHVLNLSTDLATHGYQINGATDFGSAIAAGDVNGDGIPDLIVGDSNASTDLTARGLLPSPSGLTATPSAAVGAFPLGWWSYYRVSAVDALGVEGPASPPYSAFSSAGPLGAIDVSWNTVPGARWYRIYSSPCCTPPPGYYQVDAPATTFTDVLGPATPGVPVENLRNGGAAYVVFGQTSPGVTIDALAMTAAQGYIAVGTAGSAAGSAVAAGDLNGDGRPDVVVGADNASTVTVIDGKLDPATLPTLVNGSHYLDLSTITQAQGSVLNGSGEAGTSVTTLDFNGDGKLDLAIGAPGINRAYVALGPITANRSLDDMGATEGLVITDGFASMGTVVANGGDFNADGRAELLLLGPEASTNGRESGAVELVFGQSNAQIALLPGGFLSINGDQSYRFDGSPTGDGESGGDELKSLAVLGDITGDGRPDIAIGTTEPHFGRGRVYVAAGVLVPPPSPARVSGRVTYNNNTGAVPGAEVDACTAGGVCKHATADASGNYVLPLDAGDYTFTVRPGLTPPLPDLIPQTSAPQHLVSGDRLVLDFDMLSLHAPPAPPISPVRGNGSPPTVYWGDVLHLTQSGCVNGTGDFTVTQGPVIVRSGAMTESPPGSGTYRGTISPTFISDATHGYARITITIHCPGLPDEVTPFDIYIDPSGTVQDTAGHPIAGATVTLLMRNPATGLYEAVPDGSLIMSIANRHNPDTTDAFGRFGWDVLAGVYKVHAEAPGCTSSDAGPFIIPPPVLGIVITLVCDITPPVTTASGAPPANAAGWNMNDVLVSLAAVDNPGGSGVKEITYSATGAQPIVATTVTGAAVTLPAITTEGVTVIHFFAKDVAGNIESEKTFTVKLDKTNPSVVFGAPAAPNAAGWYKADVSFPFTASDAGGSGLESTTPAASPLIVTGEGRAVSGDVTARDVAGNSATFHSPSVMIDRHKPSPPGAAATRPPDFVGASGAWYKDSIAVHFTAGTDPPLADGTPGSGVDPASVPTDQTFTTNGPNTASGTEKDLAGNESDAATLTVKVDNKPPPLTATATNADGTPYVAGTWTNQNVIVTFTCTDGESGVASFTAPVTISADGSGQTAHGACTDNVGHTSTTDFGPVNIDRTAPEAAMSFSVPSKDIAITGRDAGSGVPSGAIAPSSVVPTPGDEGDRSNAELRTYRIVDRAGNVTILTVKVKKGRNSLDAVLLTIKYGAAAVINLISNQSQFEWALNRDGSLKTLDQQMQLQTEGEVQGQHSDTSAKYTASKNTTTIKSNDKKVVLPGLVLLRMLTNNGALSIAY